VASALARALTCLVSHVRSRVRTRARWREVGTKRANR
jgi:hypothetical protein